MVGCPAVGMGVRSKDVFPVPPPVGSRRCVDVHYGYILEIYGHSPASRETYYIRKLNMVSCQDRRPRPVVHDFV